MKRLELMRKALAPRVVHCIGRECPEALGVRVAVNKIKHKVSVKNLKYSYLLPLLTSAPNTLIDTIGCS